MKHCPLCNQDLSADAYYPDKAKRDGLHYACRECVKAKRKAYHAENRDLILAKNKVYYEANRDKWLDSGRKVRVEAIEAYGGKCACCNESTFEFLAIDHVNNDGEEHRKEMQGYGRAIYRWLKKNGYPQDGRFQVLCHNCNMAKGLYGLCPHQGQSPYVRAKHLKKERAA